MLNVKLVLLITRFASSLSPIIESVDSISRDDLDMPYM